MNFDQFCCRLGTPYWTRSLVVGSENCNTITKCFIYSGVMTFNELLELGKDEHRTDIATISESLHFDQPINIQFTSVRNLCCAYVFNAWQLVSPSGCITPHLVNQTIPSREQTFLLKGLSPFICRWTTSF